MLKMQLQAVNYYEAALKSSGDVSLRYDLCELLFRLKRHDKCEKVIRAGLEARSKMQDSISQSDEAKLHSLMARHRIETGNDLEAERELTIAKDLQASLLRRPAAEVGDHYQQRLQCSKLCVNLGKHYERTHQLQLAADQYSEALQYAENDTATLQKLAQLLLALGDVQECHRRCQMLLKLEPDNDDATLLLADLAYQQSDTDTALSHFNKLLERNPSQYHALARIVELSWRTGELEQAERYLRSAIERSSRATLDAGYNYCAGLYQWYTGDPNSALQHFNRARRDLAWGERATYNIIEICLNPDNEIVGRSEDEQYEEDEEVASQQAMGVRMAEKYLAEIRSKPGLDHRFQLIEQFVLLHSNNRAQVEQAQKSLMAMVPDDIRRLDDDDAPQVRDVGAWLGIARSHLILKQTTKAKNLLKRVANGRQSWTIDDADYLEQCWLLLADIYIGQTKYDNAVTTLNTLLHHNNSCPKAYEFLAFIKEKEGKWSDAAANYLTAWNICKRRHPGIGYKLAYNQLKCKQYTKAINVCHRVLELYPEYPKIRKEILDKARWNLRL